MPYNDKLGHKQMENISAANLRKMYRGKSQCYWYLSYNENNHTYRIVIA